jgi:lipid-A-disaccharide synthase
MLKSVFKHIVLIAGEESGDQHAAKLLHQLQSKYPDIKASGFGGIHLKNAGMDVIFDLTTLAITGLTGVLSHLHVIRKAFQLIQAHLRKHEPDLVILVDYPGFNLRLAKWIKKNIACPILYYVSPQVWAWKAGRIETIRQVVDHMAVILPFEKTLYDKENIPSTYVGHPLLESISQIPSQLDCRAGLGLQPTEKILAFLPGSRKQEILRHVPVMLESLKRLAKHSDFQDIKIIIPIAKSLDQGWVESFFQECPYSYTCFDGNAQMVVQAADAVVVASGTASLECALLLKPSCIIYRSSWLNYYLATLFMKVKYLGLANLLLNQLVFPELLQPDCNPIELEKMIIKLLKPSLWRDQMVDKLNTIHEILKPVSNHLLLDLSTQLLEKNKK